MDPQLQRAYDALQQADAAGNVEDAQQIADYIRQLQTQQENKAVLEAGEESMIENPIAAGAVGAIAGPVAGKVLETAYGPKGVTTTAPSAAPGAAPGAPGQKYAAKTGYGAGSGETVREVVEEFKKQEAPLGKGKVTSKIKGGPLGGPKAMQQIASKEADAARFAQMRAANQAAAQKAGSVPARIAQSTAGKMPLLLKSAAGAGAGLQASDAYNRMQQGDYLGAGLGAIGAAGSAASLIPHPITRIGGTAIGMGAGALNAYIDYLKSKAQPQPMKNGGLAGYAKGKAVKDIAKKINFDRFKIGEMYPDVIPPAMATDPKTGKVFAQKQLSPEAIEVQKARKLAQKEIEAGEYEPLFDISKRFYADPSRYQLAGTTLTDIVPKKADTISKYEELANRPESVARLRGAFDIARDRPMAKDWYAMGQLEKEFIKELGPVEGPKQFRARFADAMAATTGGADPNSNLMMAAFANYQKALGKEIPTVAADLPFPIGGRFVSGNMEQAKKLQDVGLIPVTNPKRHNFSANFLGYRDRSTLDEQMSQLWDPKMMAPPPNAYGIYEQALAKEAKRAGVEPANFQDIAWAGAKDYPGKPMMQEINEMVARTSKITGLPQEEVLKGFIRGNRPMYGIAGAGAGVSMDEEEKAEGGSVHGYAKGKRVISAARDLILPPAENAARTQIIGTLPTYAKAAELLKQRGATGRGIDVGAGLGEGSKILGKNFDTMEPYAKGWKPTYTSAEQMPSDAYGQLTNLNVLNVMPREARDELVENIGRTMEPGGLGILTTRGADVMKAQGRPGPEEMSMITSRDTYQKGFTKQELEDYLRYILGEKFDVNKLNLGPAGAVIQKKAEGGSTTPAWQRKEGKSPSGGLNAAGRASYKRETGGTLKAPQPEGGSRKKSFCARMGGMKKKLTSSKTANDPDSRINKALRKWKC